MKPLPFREVKRKLEAAGFSEAGQTGSHIKFVRITASGTRTAIVQNITRLPPELFEAFCDRLESIRTSSMRFEKPQKPDFFDDLGVSLPVEVLHKYSRGVLAVTPDNTVALSSADDNSIEVWDLKTGDEVEIREGRLCFQRQTSAQTRRTFQKSLRACSGGERQASTFQFL